MSLFDECRELAARNQRKAVERREVKHRVAFVVQLMKDKGMSPQQAAAALPNYFQTPEHRQWLAEMRSHLRGEMGDRDLDLRGRTET